MCVLCMLVLNSVLVLSEPSELMSSLSVLSPLLRGMLCTMVLRQCQPFKA